VCGLEVLELGLLAAQCAKTIAPTQRQLQDGEIARLLRDLTVDLRDARIGGWQGDRQMFE